MKKLPCWLLLMSSFVHAQSIDVEYDRNRDFSVYKTFKFGDSQIITPEDQKKISDEKLNKWVISAITEELTLKGLKKSDSAADLTITYAAGTLARSDVERVGPVPLTPGRDANSNMMYEYRQISLIIDLNDRSNNLIWRINSTTNMTGDEGEGLIDAIVVKGFKKFGRAPKHKRK
ncbi:MAG: DUF4136 domain-containing protein [Flammeovirgaceae bacterium]